MTEKTIDEVMVDIAQVRVQFDVQQGRTSPLALINERMLMLQNTVKTLRDPFTLLHQSQDFYDTTIESLIRRLEHTSRDISDYAHVDSVSESDIQKLTDTLNDLVRDATEILKSSAHRQK